ncbi:hypothetical protein Tco_0433017 [Tanacetum coccineum]|uniref:Uncharacterized protein n=1 Tax=Tanacetum coccineum TaxID=301880 RepID=A0ABQ4XZU7_9ASTR
MGGGGSAAERVSGRIPEEREVLSPEHNKLCYILQRTFYSGSWQSGAETPVFTVIYATAADFSIYDKEIHIKVASLGVSIYRYGLRVSGEFLLLGGLTRTVIIHWILPSALRRMGVGASRPMAGELSWLIVTIFSYLVGATLLPKHRSTSTRSGTSHEPREYIWASSDTASV